MTTSILVVDDDLDFLERVSEELRQIPEARVTVAHSVPEALSLLEEYSFDLIVSDWALNSDTASELLRTADPLQAADIKTPVLFMSGSEKIGGTAGLKSLKRFEPVSFIIKRCGPPLIGLLAENILQRFDHHHGHNEVHA